MTRQIESKTCKYGGYVYDVETGLYYLRSRYYNPGWQRFIDSDLIIGGNQYNNLFLYCSNSPINKIDFGGFEESDIDDSFLFEDDALTLMIILGIDVNHLAPNTAYHYIDTKGYDRYIWTDSNGKVIHSRHYTDHGKKHHAIPHDHNWHKKDDGSDDHEQDHTALPPDNRYSEEDAIEYHMLPSPAYDYTPDYTTDFGVLLYIVLELSLYFLGVPVPIPA